MATFIKSLHDGLWYPDVTQWSYILDSLCDALGYFSESDCQLDIHDRIDSLADEVFNIVKLQVPD